MAEEKVVPPVPAAKRFKYVGPGSERTPGQTPTISNIPFDVKQPRLGCKPIKLANELTQEEAEYVMQTNPSAKGWWVFE